MYFSVQKQIQANLLDDKQSTWSRRGSRGVTWPQKAYLPRVPGPFENTTPQILAFYGHASSCVPHESQHQQVVGG